MAIADSKFLDINDPFPNLELQLSTGETFNLPEDFGGNYGIVLIYRGDW